MTSNELFSRVRRQLSDTQPNTDIDERWTVTIRILYLNDALNAMWVSFPEAFFEDEIITDPPAVVTSATLDEQLVISNRYTANAMHFICGRCLSEDSEDANNQALAVAHYTQSGMDI